MVKQLDLKLLSGSPRSDRVIRAGVISADADRSGLQRVVLPPGTAPLRREFLAVHRPGLRPPVIDELITQLPPAPRSLRP